MKAQENAHRRTLACGPHPVEIATMSRLHRAAITFDTAVQENLCCSCTMAIGNAANFASVLSDEGRSLR